MSILSTASRTVLSRVSVGICACSTSRRVIGISLPAKPYYTGRLNVKRRAAKHDLPLPLDSLKNKSRIGAVGGPRHLHVQNAGIAVRGIHRKAYRCEDTDRSVPFV